MSASAPTNSGDQPPSTYGNPPPPPPIQTLLPVNPPITKVDCSKTPNDPSCPPPPVDCKANPTDPSCPKCDPSYPGNCFSSPPPNLNCDDVKPKKNFKVTGSDPHGFDRDHDGIGCEDNGNGGGNGNGNNGNNNNNDRSSSGNSNSKSKGSLPQIASVVTDFPNDDPNAIEVHVTSAKKDSIGAYHVRGEIKNISNEILQSVLVTAHFLDESGQPVGSTTCCYAQPSDIDPGHTSTFDSFSQKDELSGTPTSYRLSFDWR